MAAENSGDIWWVDPAAIQIRNKEPLANRISIWFVTVSSEFNSMTTLCYGPICNLTHFKTDCPFHGVTRFTTVEVRKSHANHGWSHMLVMGGVPRSTYCCIVINSSVASVRRERDASWSQSGNAQQSSHFILHYSGASIIRSPCNGPVVIGCNKEVAVLQMTSIKRCV